MLGIKGKSYDVYQNLKNKVILQSQKELNKKTNINFEFEEIKTGRKVTSLNFHIHANKSIKSNIKAIDEVCTTREGKPTNKEENRSKELINEVGTIFKEEITGLEGGTPTLAHRPLTLFLYFLFQMTF